MEYRRDLQDENPCIAETYVRLWSLPYFIQSIEIENFLCIKHVRVEGLPGDAQWIFLLGENGEGKTAFLQALAIGVCGTKNAEHLLSDQKKCRIRVNVAEQEREKENLIKWEEWGDVRAWQFVARPDYFCAYGPSRLEIQGDRSIGQEAEDIDPEVSLLKQRGNLRNIERWILGQKLKGESDPKAEIRLRNVTALLTDLLPNVSKIEIEKDYLVYIEKGFRARIHQVASGHKSILAMVGDLMIRLFEMQPDETRPEALKGMVVVDELDVHIHPLHQRAFPKLLSKSFPLLQFICSTHSPLPLLGAPAGSRFFVVERDETRGAVIRDPGVDVTALHPNALLTSPLFRVESLVSEALKDYDDLDPEDHFREIVERKEIEDNIIKASQEENPIPDEWFEE